MVETIKEVYIENKLDYGKFILEPEAQKKYEQITKDFALSNLERGELKICILRQEILNFIVLNNCLEWLPNSFESFQRDQHTTLQLNRSKFGFQSKLERANLTGDTQGEKNFEKEKAKTIFGGGN
jgi:hypothetical protein